MDSSSIVWRLCHLVQLIETLAEDAVCYKSNCQNVAFAICYLKAPLNELEQFQTSWNVGELLSKLESRFLKLKELVESCNGKTSSSISVLLKQLLFKELASNLQALLKALPFDTLPVSENCKELVQECIISLESVDNVNGSNICVVEEVDRALKDIKKGAKLSHGMLVSLAEKLGLRSNQEILKEASLLEKQKNLAQLNRNKKEEEFLNLLIVLVTQMSDDLAEQKNLQAQQEGISIPADFRCPLSLELMSDPVIVASGQTYERAYIQRWLDEGNTTCPKSRQSLNHFTLINNVTVKGLIASWCEQNGVSLPEPCKTPKLPLQSAPVPMSNGIQRSTENGSSLPNMGNDAASQQGGESVQTISRCQGECESGRETGTGGSSVKSRRIFSHGLVRDVLDRPERASLLSLAGEHSMDALVSLGRHTSNSCHGSSSNDTSIELDAKRSISLPNKLWVDDSGNLASLTLSPSDVSSQVEDYVASSNAVERGLVSMGHDAAGAGPSSLENAQSDTGMKIDGGDIQSKVQGLVRDLQSTSWDVQRNAAIELRLLAKFELENRIIIADSGAIPPLILLLHSTDPQIQENAVTALLNLSINNNNKSEIASANAIGPLVHVLNVGTSDARENAAATLFSLSVMDENKITIGQSGAIDPLVDLLTNGTPRGKKDAATALFNLSICQENKIRIVRAKAVRPLVRLMSDPAAGMVDKAVAVIANLATIPEGRNSIGEEAGIPVLVEVVEMGSQRGKENAAAALLHLCSNSTRFKSRVLQEGVIPPLVALTRSGTARAKEKASALLRLFRDQRHARGPDSHGDRHR